MTAKEPFGTNGFMSEEFARKFEDKPKLASRTLPEIRKAVDAAISRLKWDDSLRTGGEQYSMTALVNGLICHFATLSEEEQDRIARLGVDLCNERLRSAVEMPLGPPPMKPPKPPRKPG